MSFDPGKLYRKTKPVRARQITTSDDIEDAYERVGPASVPFIRRGNWLITGHRGCHYIIEHEIFMEMYEEAPNAEGT